MFILFMRLYYTVQTFLPLHIWCSSKYSILNKARVHLKSAYEVKKIFFSTNHWSSQYVVSSASYRVKTGWWVSRLTFLESLVHKLYFDICLFTLDQKKRIKSFFKNVADHLLTVVFTDTPRKAHFWGSVDNVNVKQQNLTIFVCPWGWTFYFFSFRESCAKLKQKVRSMI